MTTREKLFALAKELEENGFDPVGQTIRYVAEYKDWKSADELLAVLTQKSK